MLDKEEFMHKFSQLETAVKQHLESAPGCHDFDHTLRVMKNAEQLLQKCPGADSCVVRLATLLHDIARPEEMASKGRLCHAAAGADIAEDMLRQYGFSDASLIRRVKECVKRHRYRGGEAPSTLEEMIVYDADKLDSIGAVGIGRAFHFAGREGARLHNSYDEAVNSEPYSKDDSAYREYLVKLRHVPERMMTASGRELAKLRADFMHRFFEQLNDEVSG